MPTPTKVEKVREIKERLEGSTASLISDYRGITVKDVTELRAALREAEATFTVVKNTLTKLAAADAGLAELATLLDGPTAITFVQGDVVTAAKRLADAAKRIPSLEVRGGVMEGRVLSAEQARALATLESREVLLAKMAGMAKASMSRAAYAFVALQSRFLALLDAYQEKVPPGEAPAAVEAEEAPAEEVPAEEPPEVEAPAEEAPAEEAPAEETIEAEPEAPAVEAGEPVQEESADAPQEAPPAEEASDEQASSDDDQKEEG